MDISWIIAGSTMLIVAVFLIVGTIAENAERKAKEERRRAHSSELSEEHKKIWRQYYKQKGQEVPKEFLGGPDENDESCCYELYFEIKGISYRSEYEINEARQLKLGDRLILKHEWNNEYDENAIQIFTQRGTFIGYVPMYLSSTVRKDIYRLVSCTVSGVVNTPWIHIYVYAKFRDEDD